MIRPSIICGIANAITVLAAAFIFLHYIFHESTGSDAKEMNNEEVELFRHHKRVLPESEHFTNVSLIQEHYCPAHQSNPCWLKAFSHCGNSSRSVSLTFDVDERWSKASLDGIVEELKGVRIAATFFLSGQDPIDHEDRCEQIQSLIEAGHEVQIMNWNGAELHSDQPIEELGIDQAIAFFRNCLGKQFKSPLQFRPVRGKITLEQARRLSEQYDFAIAMWSLSSNPDRVEHLIDLADDAVALNDSIVIRCSDPDYWSDSGPISRLVSYFQDRQYRFLPSNRCYQLCSSRLCLTPQSG